MPGLDPVPLKFKELLFTIPPSLREAFIAEPRIILDQHGNGHLLFSKKMLEDAELMRNVATDVGKNAFEMVATLPVTVSE